MASEKDTLELAIKATLTGDNALRSVLKNIEAIKGEAAKIGGGGFDGLDKSVEEAKGSAVGLNDVFTNLVAGGAIIAASKQVLDFASESLGAFQDLEKGMAEVFTLLPGITADAKDKMSADVRALALETGRLPEEVIPALYQAISAGVPQDSVFDFMRTASDAALGGVTDLETAVDGITSVVNAYGAEAISAGQASDIMFTAAKLGKTDFSQMSASLSNVTPIASALGVQFGDVAAALATVTTKGTLTSVATTQLRQLLVELSKDGTKTSDTFKEVAGVGFSQFIAQGGNVQDALMLMEQAARDSGVGINDLFGSVEAGSIALSLTGNNTDSFTRSLNEMIDTTGASQAAAETMGETGAQAMARLAAVSEEIKISLGEGLAPAVADVAETILELSSIALPYLQQEFAELGVFLENTTRGMNLYTRTGKDLSGIAAQVAGVVGDEALSAAEKMKILENAVEVGGIKGRIAGTSAEVEAGMAQIVAEVARGAGTFEEAIARVEAAGIDIGATTGYVALREEWENLQYTSISSAGGVALAALGVTSAAEDVANATDGMAEANENLLSGVERLPLSMRTAANSVHNLGSEDEYWARQQEVAENAAASLTDQLEEQSKAMEEQAKIAEALRQQSIATFNGGEGMFDDLFAGYDELSKAENAQINLTANRVYEYDQAGKEIADISQRLAGDLSSDQKTAYEDILGTVSEGSAEWLSAYNALQGDLSDSARSGLVAQMSELQGDASALAGQGLEPVYAADSRAAEEARKKIEEANAAIIASYKATAFEALLAQTGVTESTLALAVNLGIMSQAEADARLEFTNTTTAITALAESQTFAAASTADQTEAVQLLSLGYASTAEEALAIAANLAGPLAASLTNATSLTEGQKIQLDALTGASTTAGQAIQDELVPALDTAASEAFGLATQNSTTLSPALDEAAQRALALKNELAGLEGKKSAAIELEIGGIDALREAVRLANGLTGGGTAKAAAGTTVEAFADGGNMRAGVPSLVGERGPELLFPTRNAFVATNDQTSRLLQMSAQAAAMQRTATQQTGNSSLSMVNNIYAQGQDAQAVYGEFERESERSLRKMAQASGLRWRQ